jgi:hypothetical protein
MLCTAVHSFRQLLVKIKLQVDVAVIFNILDRLTLSGSLLLQQAVRIEGAWSHVTTDYYKASSSRTA